MKNKIILGIVFAFAVAVAMHGAAALTLDQLLANYTSQGLFNVESGIINITSLAYGPLDTGGSTAGDYLQVNLTTNGNAGTYTFVGDLFNGNNFIATQQYNFTLSSGTNTVPLNFSARTLTLPAYNLSVKIYQNGNLVFRRYPAASINYAQSQYETPDVSLSVTGDSGLNNESDSRYDYLQLNTNINVQTSGTYTITTYVGSGNTTVFGSNQYSLNSGSNSVPLYIPSKALRKARLSGQLSVNLVQIDFQGRTYYFRPSYTTSSYSTSQLDPKASVITGTVTESTVVAAGKVDKLQFNTQLDINESATYKLESEITNQFGEYVSTIFKTSSLSTGLQTVQLELNGTDIYDSKVNGPYVMSYIKLSKQNQMTDSLDNAFISSNYTFDNFSAIPLPDVTISPSDIDVLYKGNGIADINVTVHNNGNGIAFDTDVSLIDSDANIVKQAGINLISASGIKTMQFKSVPVTEVMYVYVDLTNKVEESDEQNNLANKTIPFAKAYIATNVNSGQAPLTVQFTGTATGTGPFTYAWDFGDNTGSSQQSPSHVYSNPGQYLAVLTVNNSAENATATATINVGNPPGADWTQFHGDALHTGKSQQQLNAPFKLKWTFSTGASTLHSSPSVFANQIYIRGDNGTLYALDYNGQQQWSRNIGPWCSDVGDCITYENTERGTPAIGQDGTVYTTSNNSLYALYPNNGSIKWKFNGKNQSTSRAFASAPPVMQQNKILFGTGGFYYTGLASLYSLDDQGTNNWNFTGPGPGSYSAPVILGNTAYVTNWLIDPSSPVISAIDMNTGNELWNYTLSEPSIYSAPAADVQSNTLYVADGNSGACSSLNAFDTNNGSSKWRLITEADITSTPAIDNNAFFGLYSGNFYAVNSSGQVSWTFKPGTSPIYSSPAIAGSTLYLGANGSLYGLDKNTGDIIWKYPLNNEIKSSPALSGNRLYVGADDGNLYAFEQYPLTVNAGSDQTVLQGTTVTLTAQAADGQGTITAYNWTEGSTQLSTAQSFSQQFAIGHHKIKLTVYSSSLVNVSDYVNVDVNPNPPQPSVHGTLISSTAGTYTGYPYNLTAWWQGHDGIAGYRSGSADNATIILLVKWAGNCRIDPCQVRWGAGYCFTGCNAYDKDTFKCTAENAYGPVPPGGRTDGYIYLYTDGSASTLIDNVTIPLIAEGTAPIINNFVAPGPWKNDVQFNISLTDPTMTYNAGPQNGSVIGWIAFFNGSVAPQNFLFNYPVDGGENFTGTVNWTTSLVNNGENKTLNICAEAFDKLKYNTTNCINVYVDKKSPVISSVNSIPSYNSATITWSTDESANSLVDYGTSSTLGLSTSNSTLVSSHSILINNLAPGTYYYAVTSCDAVNNCASSGTQTFNVVANTNLPDLTVINFTAYNSSANQGVFIPFVIKNIGNIGAGNFYWKVFANGPSPDASNAGTPLTLVPNQTMTVYAYLNYTAAGTYTPLIVVDDQNQLQELNENNNNQSVTLVIS